MKRSILTLLVLAILCEPAIARSELLSIKFPALKDQYIDGFKIETWGVDILAVCHVPDEWRITAGHYEDSAGVLSGETKEGRSQPDVADFANIFLVEVHQYQPNAKGPHGEHPASFAGSVHVGPFGDDPKPHDIRFKAADFTRTPAERCPAPRAR